MAAEGVKRRILSAVIVLVLMVLSTMPLSLGYTDPRDVYAINNLYASLGSPPLPGWISSGGDPCFESWQGVQCVISNITGIVLNGANLGGQLGDKLDYFTSIITLDLSNNHIGGSIPENLPVTMREFFLSDNKLTGIIPNSISELALLSDMSVNGNNLTGEIPDAFQSLTSLVNLDLSSNNLSGSLPPSMGNLTSLTTLHIENNRLIGLLDTLQDLPLKDLNIENNLFSGPVPEKLLSIPNFIKDGNPFNTTIAPSPLLPPPLLPLSGALSPKSMPVNTAGGPSGQETDRPIRRKSLSVARVLVIVVVGVSILLVSALLIFIYISKYQRRELKHEEVLKGQDWKNHRWLEEQKYDGMIKQNNGIAEDQVEAFEKKKLPETNVTGEHAIRMPQHSVEQVTARPVSSSAKMGTPSAERLNHSSSVTSFSIASLQQYTNSFDEDSLIRKNTWGNVYIGELPNGKLLEVMKLDNVSLKMPPDEFVELALGVSELQHPNIVELVGYCAEFEQQILVYNYYNWTLCDILHYEDDVRRRLSWNSRLQVALGAAKALEYLHEIHRPPVIYRNFGSVNILLDKELGVHVSECGLASFMSSSSAFLVPGRAHALLGYAAPELNESAPYTGRSDVYSFGVVMLELLTGRKPYDSSKPRAEQHLVRWASSQLHDINALAQMVDPSVEGKYTEKTLSRFADIISRCIQGEPEFRPPMSQVVHDLSLVVEEAVRRDPKWS